MTDGRRVIRFQSMTLAEGLEYLRRPTQVRKLGGYWVENKEKSTRLKMFATGELTCVECGITGTHFHIERSPFDKVMPSYINLYAQVGDEEVLMTWDHILPKSLGGSDDLINAQCMCTNCNGQKGNHVELSELIAIAGCEQVLAMNTVKGKNGRIKETLEEALAAFEAIHPWRPKAKRKLSPAQKAKRRERRKASRSRKKTTTHPEEKQ